MVSRKDCPSPVRYEISVAVHQAVGVELHFDRLFTKVSLGGGITMSRGKTR